MHRDIQKYASFLSKNADIPLTMKCMMLEAALKAKFFDQCQSWWTNDMSAIGRPHFNTLKTLLGVHQQTFKKTCILGIRNW